MILTIFLFVFSYDIWFYISHRILHLPFFYTRIHKKHHSVDYKRMTPGKLLAHFKEMTYKDAYVSDIREDIFQSLGFFIPIYFLQNITLWQGILSLLFVNLRGMARHDIRMIPFIGDHHILHHANPKVNYGEKWIDIVFQTNSK